MKALTDHIKRVVSIPDDALENIVNTFQKKVIRKKSHLLRAGQHCDSYHFVEQGALRIFTTVDNKEITSWFAFQDYFFTELESYVNNTPTRFNIQALENTTVYFIPRNLMDNHLKEYPSWGEFVRRTWELSFVKLQQVVLSFQTQSAEQRYEDLFKYPDFVQKTKLEDLATMLGITKFSLSRLRGKK